MDYIDGENLNEIVKHNGPLPEGKAVNYIEKVGEALEYIHSRNMTHFDVKPANIVIRKKDDQPILIDFGLSKQYDAHGDATSTLMQGISQGYSPIELYNYGSVSTFSPQTDVYSLGATLLYLVSGKVPPQPSAIIEEGLDLSFVSDSQLKKAIESAMQVGRGKRPESVKTFSQELSTTENKAESKHASYTSDEDETTRIILDPDKIKGSTGKPKDTNTVKRMIKISFIIKFFLITAICVFVTIGIVNHCIKKCPHKISEYSDELDSFVLNDSIEELPSIIDQISNRTPITIAKPKYREKPQ